MPLNSLAGFMRGKMFGSGHKTAMFLLEDDNVVEQALEVRSGST